MEGTNQRDEDRANTMKRIREELRHFPLPDNPLIRRALSIVRRRLGKAGRSSRAKFVRTIAEYLTKDTWDEFAVKVALVAEVSACITYMENQLVDGKYRINKVDLIRDHHIAAQMLEGILDEYVDRSFGERSGEIRLVLQEVHSCFSYGEFIERNILNYDVYLQRKNWKNILVLGKVIEQKIPLDEIEAPLKTWVKEYNNLEPDYPFWQAYIKRSYLINTVLYEKMTDLLINHYQPLERDAFQNLIRFARNYGLTQQMVNDCLDFIPVNRLKAGGRYWPFLGYGNGAKKFEDAFADIRNGILTLPIIVFLSLKKGERHNLFLPLIFSNAIVRFLFTLNVLQKPVSEYLAGRNSETSCLGLADNLIQVHAGAALSLFNRAGSNDIKDAEFEQMLSFTQEFRNNF